MTRRAHPWLFSLCLLAGAAQAEPGLTSLTPSTAPTQTQAGPAADTPATGSDAVRLERLAPLVQSVLEVANHANNPVLRPLQPLQPWVQQAGQVGYQWGSTVGQQVGQAGQFLGNQVVQVGQQMLDVGQQVSKGAVDVVGHALSFLGVPYKRGGTSAETGFDCSGFVGSMYEQTLGRILPRKASAQAAATEPVDKKDLQPGDLVFFNTMRRAFSHVGIYIGNGEFVHAPKPGAKVRVERLDEAYWKRRFNGARRVESNP